MKTTYDPYKLHIREFQRKLKAERTVRGISQMELAREIGVTQPHLSYIESGRRELTPKRYGLILERFNQKEILENG